MSIRLSKQGAALEQRKARVPKEGSNKLEAELMPSSSFSVLPSYPPVRSLEWQILEYKRTSKTETRRILQNIVGRADKGSFTAIMGPSGSGKTSLLNCLSLRCHDFTGGVRVDGKPVTSSFFDYTGYIYQDELFFCHLTVREHLTYYAINHLRSNTQDERKERVDKVLKQLNLSLVADSRIGGGLFMASGLSGGEMKRLNTASALLTDPRILLLDEPISAHAPMHNTGLDSVTAAFVMSTLKSLVADRIVITSVHAPSTQVFSLFSHVILLTSHGEIAYQGPRTAMLSYLEGLGHICPLYMNPADLILQLASSKVIEEGTFLRPGALPVLTDSDTCTDLARAYAEIAKEEKLLEPDTTYCITAPRLLWMGASSKWVGLFHSNLRRCWLQQKREWRGLAVGMVNSVGIGLLVGLLYTNQATKDPKGRYTPGFLFMLVATVLFCPSVAITLTFPLDFSILVRECYSGDNHPLPYFLARTLVIFPFHLHVLFIPVIPYYMAGFMHDFSSGAWYILIMTLLVFGAQSLGFFCSACARTTHVALAMLPLILRPMILFNGLLYPHRLIPSHLHPFEEFSMAKASLALVSINHARGVSEKAGRSLLGKLEVQPEQFGRIVLQLIFLGLLFRVLAYTIIFVRVQHIFKKGPGL